MNQREIIIDEATLREWAYKTPAMRSMIVHVLSAALRKPEFSAMDLPVHGETEHGGPGIAGTVIRQLIKDGIISRVGTFDGPHFCPRVIRNAGGNNIGVYRLANPSLARTLLERHCQSDAPKYEQIGLL